MTLNDVSHAKLVGHKVLVSKLEELLELLLTALKDEVRSRVDVGSVTNGGAEDLNVVRRDSVGEGEDFADSFGNGDLYTRGPSARAQATRRSKPNSPGRFEGWDRAK
jgi:hypothetical protein